MSLPWSDPNSNPVQDVRDYKRYAEEQYARSLTQEAYMEEKQNNEPLKVPDNVLKPEEPKKLRRPSDYVTDETLDDPNKLAMLARMQFKPIYQGTVFGAEKEKRRAKNKRARAARRKNR